MQIIDQFLSNQEFALIANLVTSSKFPWYFQEKCTFNYSKDSYSYFTHVAVNEFQQNSDHAYLFNPVLKKLDINTKSVRRIKCNCYPRTHVIEEQEPHQDYKESHLGAILYLNTNNGFTRLGTKVVESVANRLLIFDPATIHNSSNCTDSTARFNINFNFSIPYTELLG